MTIHVMNPLGPQFGSALFGVLNGLHSLETRLGGGQAASSLAAEFRTILQNAQEHPEIAQRLQGVALPQEDAVTEDVLRRLMGEVRNRLPEAPSSARGFQTGFPISRRLSLPPLSISDHVVALDDIQPGKHGLYSDKASRLAQMRKLGVCVPPAVVMTSELVRRIIDDFSTRQDVGNSLTEIVARLEKETGLRFGDRKQPLVLSVRSGGQKVMEGLLPTLQFVGLNSRTVKGLGQKFQDVPGAYRLYLQYVIEFGVTIRGVPRELFGALLKTPSELERILTQTTGKKARKRDVVQEYKRRVATARRVMTLHKGGSFPEDPFEQLQATIVRISEAWKDPHAQAYRERYRIPHDPPAALLLQSQVFGNLGSNSAAICAYSRHPKWGVSRTREQGIIGIAKLNASGDELMTGSGEQPQRLSDLTFRMRGIADPLQQALRDAERHFRIPVKFEAIIEQGKLWVLQVSPYPMWPIAVIRSAVDMKQEGVLSLDEALAKVDDNIWKALQSPQFEPPSNADILMTGRTEISGAVSGRLVADTQALLAEKGRDRSRTKPKRDFVLITEGVDPAHWETVFERTAGIIVLGDPGAHFFHRASQAGVAVMSRVKEWGDPALQARISGLVGRKAKVWLDATGKQAYLTATALNEKIGSVARYLRGELDYEAVSGDRSREQIDQIVRFRGLIAEKQRIEAERLAAEVQDVVGRFLTRDTWDVSDLKEAILENRWAKETKPPAELFMRHDGSSDPSLQDFKYDYEGPQAAEFVRGLWESDGQSPKRLAKAFVETDELEHAFMISLFRLLPRELRAPLIEETVRAAKEMNRDPGRGCGIYVLSRAVSVLSEEGEVGRQTFASLDDQSVAFLAAEWARFFDVRFPKPGKRDDGYSGPMNRREAEGIAMKYPLLDTESKVGAFLASALGPERADRLLREESIPAPVRLWLGVALGEGEKIKGILQIEEDLRRPPVFDKEAFVANLPAADPEAVARYIVDLAVPIPELERGIHPVLETLGWGSFDFDVDQQQFVYKLSEEARALFRALYRLSPGLAANLLVETPQGTHALSLTFFRALDRSQQTEVIEMMVRVSRQKGYKPGILPGLYLLSRFVGVLAGEADQDASTRGVMEALSPEALQFVLEDFFVFHGVRTGGFRAVLESLPDSVFRDFGLFLGDRYQNDPRQLTRSGDRDYAHETYQRYPGLDPKVWLPFLVSLSGNPMASVLSGAGVAEGVRDWYDRMMHRK